MDLVTTAPRRPAATSSGRSPAKRSAPSSDDTKAKIIEAALDCLAAEGIVGVSARSIARHGDFNQALIFYHFGSVDGLLAAAALRESELRSDRYAEPLSKVSSLPDLVGVARQLYDTEFREDGTAMLVQLLAGSSSSTTVRDGVLEGFTAWMQLIDDAVERVLRGTPLAGLLPVPDVSLAIASMFVGMDMITRLDDDRERADSLLGTLEMLGTLVDGLLKALPADAITPNPTATTPTD